MKIIEVKSWPESFQAVIDNTKKFELRKNDRDYQVGDVIRMREYIPEGEHKGFTGRYTDRTITYILKSDNPHFNLGEFVILSLE